MGRNSIGSKRGSVRGAPPQIYVPFGTYDPDLEGVRKAIKFFADWVYILVFFVLIIVGLMIVTTFMDGE